MEATSAASGKFWPEIVTSPWSASRRRRLVVVGAAVEVVAGARRREEEGADGEDRGEERRSVHDVSFCVPRVGHACPDPAQRPLSAASATIGPLRRQCPLTIR